MSTSVYLSVYVCVSLSASTSPEPHLQSLPFLVHVAYSYGSVLPRRGGAIPRGRGNFGAFLPHWQCIVWAA